MGLFDISVYAIIALSYNIFIHQLISILYKNNYENKLKYSTYAIVIFGIIGIVLSKLLLKNKKYTESVVSMGLGLGGLLLIITAILVQLSGITDEIKVFITGVIFITIIYLCYKYIDQKEDN